MWVENGKVQTYRGLINADEILKILATLEGIPHSMHLRFATHGPAVQNLCHPFKVTPEDADQQAYLMHNGVLFDHAMRAEQNESDTLIFAKDLADDVRLFGNTSDILFNDDYISYMERTISGDKMVITRDDGTTVILNRDRWHEDEETGMLYSNLYSIEERITYSSSRSSKYAWMDNYTGSLDKFVSKRKGGLTQADEQAEVEEAIHEQAEREWAAAFAKLPPLLPEHAGEDNETAWTLEEGMREAVDSTEVDDELETLYFRWDGELEEFLPSNEDDAEVAIDAAEYFALWEEHEYNDSATILAYLAAQAHTGGGSDEYHDQIDDFLNNYREGLRANNGDVCIADDDDGDIMKLPLVLEDD
jgi:hypothetical protein